MGKNGSHDSILTKTGFWDATGILKIVRTATPPENSTPVNRTTTYMTTVRIAMTARSPGVQLD